MEPMMEAGRELDALVAEKVIGTKEVLVYEFYDKSTNEKSVTFDDIPHYSTDIAAAWEVVKKLDGEWTLKGHEGIGWDASFYSSTGGMDAAIIRVSANAETAPHAICLAALKALNAL